MDPKENDLSDLIAGHLNPQGSHGQRDAFLKRFIDSLKLPETFERTLASIQREHGTTHLTHVTRFVDVVLEFPDYAIAIENKPWAGAQASQLEGYRAHLDSRYGGRFCLIYLTADGRPPGSMSEEIVKDEMKAGRLALLSFQRHIPVLARRLHQDL